MTDVLHHGFASPRGDGADPTQIQPSHWNTGHKFQGGLAGQVLLRDPTDASFGAKWGPGSTVITSTDTGTIHNWAPAGMSGGNTIIYWTGASALALTGLAAGTHGQSVTIYNNGTGGATITFAHGSVSSAVGNKFFNVATSSPTPISLRGFATYYYDASIGFWVLLEHEQGAWITSAFSAADYTAQAGSWIVEAADVQYCKYRLAGRTLSFHLYVAGTTVTASAGYVSRTFFGGFTVSGSINMMAAGSDAGATRIPILVNMPAAARIDFYVNLGVTTAWQPSTNNTAVFADGTVEVN